MGFEIKNKTEQYVVELHAHRHQVLLRKNDRDNNR